MTTWTDEELRRIGRAEELGLASARADGTLRGFRPRTALDQVAAGYRAMDQWQAIKVLLRP